MCKAEVKNYLPLAKKLSLRFPLEIREDVTQMALVYAWQRLEIGERPYKDMMYNRMLDEARRIHHKYSKSEYMSGLSFVDLDEVTEEESCDNHQDSEFIEKIFASLDKVDSGILRMRFYNELNYMQIGEVVGHSHTWVRHRLDGILSGLSRFGIHNEIRQERKLHRNKLRTAESQHC